MSSRSREGRHIATASTWLLRYGFCKSREEAIKLIKRKKVLIKNKVAKTRIGYIRIKKEEISVDS